MDIKSIEIFFHKFNKIAVAFSGGTDSLFVLYILNKIKNNDIIAITLNSDLHFNKEIEFSKNFCKTHNIKHKIINIDIFKNDKLVENGVKRCYHCKLYMFNEIKKVANKLGYNTIFDGTNHSDKNSYRPGKIALKELNILSPLDILKINKQDIIKYFKKQGLKEYIRPSLPCLATRFSYNNKITKQNIDIIKDIENYIETIIKTREFRFRLHKNIGRLEIKQNLFKEFFEKNHYKKIVSYVKKFNIPFITLDLEGLKSGSMDKEINYGQNRKNFK